MIRFKTVEDKAKNKIFQQEVIERDNNTCACCGSHQNLEAHRYEDYSDRPEMMFDINNAICLCHSCHNISVEDSYHHYYRYEHNSKAQLEEYIYCWRKGYYLDRWNC